MPNLTPESAAYLFSQYNDWFGPPVISLHGETLDGRTRLNYLNERVKSNRGFALRHIPTVSAFSSGEAAKLLCLAGHYDRARKFIPASLTSAKDIAAYCHCDTSLVAPITTHRQPTPRSRTNNTIRRRDTINRITELLRYGENTTGTVDTNDLRKVLAPWL
jgi:hypothetical protein